MREFVKSAPVLPRTTLGFPVSAYLAQPRGYPMALFAKLEKKPVAPPGQARSGWKAISVMPGENCCQWAQLCTGKRFLIPEVPRLPLQGCDAPNCECRYRHFEDRRAKPRRSVERGGFSKHVDPERREMANRRVEHA